MAGDNITGYLEPDADEIGVPMDDPEKHRHKPVHHFKRHYGLRVMLSHIRGITKSDVLQKQDFRFQCPPQDTFHIDYTTTHNDYDTIMGSQFSSRGSSQLATISFNTLVVVNDYNWTIVREYSPHKITKVLKDILKTGTPIHLTAWHRGHNPEIDMHATLRTMGVEERAGEPDTRYFTVAFTQWRDPVARRRDQKQWPKYHLLDSNDTLHDLAVHYYGSARGGHHIGNENKGLGSWGMRTPIIKNKQYKAGDKIKIPPPPRRRPHYHAGETVHTSTVPKMTGALDLANEDPDNPTNWDVQ